ncbi:TAXI family TRAP transporter solute-binding subunit [Gordonia rubripertincta]|uniref:TAXI family TRAP transporter solute-binding subunit n=1 Tax=Gordonia rubripertincta TaxID=36822 RepID=UPI000B8DB448|nr:TAXI family TRAP transporter solute-binding subunit [Gordonia rubripertincta]ASR01990.1 alkanesulfonate transporter substrate-binding subunit [Gordonia rubripertincta]
MSYARGSVDRRTVLRGCSGLGALILLSACGTERGAPVRLAAGETGGFFWEFAGLLAAAADRSGAPPIRPRQSNGSAENLDALSEGSAELALSLRDAAVERADPQLTALGCVYENYFQVAVRADSGIASVADLRGRVVSVGAPGSGAARLSERVLAAAGLGPERDIRPVRQTMREARAALADGEVDAVMWAGGLPTPAFADPQVPIALLDLGGIVPALRQRHGLAYEPVRIPADIYGRHPAVTTVGVANLLLARRDVPDATAAAVVDLLLDESAQLVPAQAIGSQFLDAQSLIVTGPIPLHPGAAGEYRRRHG